MNKLNNSYFRYCQLTESQHLFSDNFSKSCTKCTCKAPYLKPNNEMCKTKRVAFLFSALNYLRDNFANNRWTYRYLKWETGQVLSFAFVTESYGKPYLSLQNLDKLCYKRAEVNLYINIIRLLNCKNKAKQLILKIIYFYTETD